MEPFDKDIYILAAESNWIRRAYPNPGVTYVDRFAVVHGQEEGYGIQVFAVTLPSSNFSPNATEVEIYGYRWQLSNRINGDNIHYPSFVYRCIHPICSARIICDTISNSPNWTAVYFIGTHEHRPHAPVSPSEPIIITTYEDFQGLIRGHNELLNRCIRPTAVYAQSMNFQYGTPRSGHGRPLILDGFPTQHNFIPNFVPTAVDTSLDLRGSSVRPSMVRGESSSCGLHRSQQPGLLGAYSNQGPHRSQQPGLLGAYSNKGIGFVPYSRQPSSSNASVRGNKSTGIHQINAYAQLCDSHRLQHERVHPQRLVQNQASNQSSNQALNQTFSSFFERQPSFYFRLGSRQGNTSVEEGRNEPSSSTYAAGEGGRNPEAHNTEFHGDQTENRPAQQREADNAEATVKRDE